ncbi:MAG: hypothetical protein IPP40_13275 [bacterium]|nr:hypothetical protein [bacterium]
MPSLPDEPWDAYLSDLDNNFVNYEDYSISGSAIGSITFWGVHAGCAPGAHSFEILFIDSVNNLTQTYNVTLTGTVLNPVYIGAYRLTEYVTQLTPPCTIANGYVRIAATGDGGCPFYWTSTNLGNGNNSLAGFVGGPYNQTAAELAFCLGQAPCVVDSLTYLLDSPGNAILRWYQNLPGVVTIWYTTDPNAVYPAGYSSSSIYYPAGNNSIGTNANFADNVRVVLTLDCTIAPPATAITPPQFLIIENDAGK